MNAITAKPKGMISATFRILAAAVFLAALAPSFAKAENTPQPADLPQVVTEAAAPAGMPILKETTHPTIQLSPDDSELVKLDRDAGLVVVGNPEHANVIADSTRTLVIIPRKPGATYFTVMGTDGSIVMRRLIIVAGPEEHYVRVKNTCRSGGGQSCTENNVYYCPDTCHKIIIGAEEKVTIDSKDVPGGAQNGVSGDNQSAQSPSASADDGADPEETEEGSE